MSARKNLVVTIGAFAILLAGVHRQAAAQADRRDRDNPRGVKSVSERADVEAEIAAILQRTTPGAARHAELAKLVPAGPAHGECTAQDAPDPRGGGVASFETNQNRRWPGGIVPYDFNADLPAGERAIAENAMARIEQFADVEFVPAAQSGLDYAIRFFNRAGQGNFTNIGGITPPWCRDQATLDLFNDPTMITDDAACNNSCPGRCIDRLPIQIVDWQRFSTVLHEILHTLSFHHTQKRADRDEYVEYWDANVQSGQESQFNLDANAFTGLPYDYFSIMHYSSCAFSNCDGVCGVESTFWTEIAYSLFGGPCGGPIPYGRTLTVIGGDTVNDPNFPFTEALGQSNDLSRGDKTALSLLFGNTQNRVRGFAANQYEEQSESIACGEKKQGFLDQVKMSLFTGETAFVNSTLWYEFTGTGGVVFLSANANANLGIRIFNEAVTTRLAIFGENDDYRFTTQAGVTYKVSVSQPDVVNMDTLRFGTDASFWLELRCGEATNDGCSDAVSLNLDNASLFGEELFPDLNFATNDGSATCGSSSASPDVWYKFRAPKDGTLEVWTEGDVDNNQGGVLISPEAVVSLHTACPGVSGNQLVCDNTDGCVQAPGGCVASDAYVSRSVSEGEEVLVRISHEAGLLRDGLLEIDYRFRSATNCDNAPTLVDGVLESVDLRFELSSFCPAASCKGASGSGFGYGHYFAFDIPDIPGTLVVEGFGAPDLDVGVVVNSGGCVNAEPLGGGDDCGSTVTELACAAEIGVRNSRAEYLSDGGETVSVRVFSNSPIFAFPPSAGRATVRASYVPTPPDNDLCGTAVEISPGGDVLLGSTRAASEDNIEACGISATGSAGVWYHIVGNGSEITATTCSSTNPAASTDFDTQISVYSGSCVGGGGASEAGESVGPETRVCVTGNDNAPGCGTASTVTFATEPGEDYFILVQGKEAGPGQNVAAGSPPTGDFSLVVFETGTEDAPEVSSIVRTHPTQTEAAEVSFLAEFNVPVEGVDATDFAPLETNTLTGSVVTAVRHTNAADFDDPAAEARTEPFFTLRARTTIEAWIKGSGTVFNTRSIDANTGMRFVVESDGSLLFTTFAVRNYNSVGSYVDTTSWTHVAVVFDAFGEANFYVDGVLVEIVDGNTPAGGTDLAGLIGGDFFSGSGLLDGSLAELRVWEIERTAGEIAAGMFNPPDPFTSGLLAYWPLDRFVDVGAGVPGTNDFLDLSANALHADAANVALVPGRPLEKGMTFDPALNTEIHVEPLPEMFVSPFTMEAWVRFEDVPGSGQRQILGQNSAGFTGGVMFKWENGALKYSSSDVQDYSVPYAFVAGVWYHVSVVLDASNDATFFVDGESIGTVAGTDPPIALFSQPLRIGSGNITTLDREWYGDLDEIRYWNHARTSEQLKSKMHVTLTGSEGGLLGHWSLDGFGTPDPLDTLLEVRDSSSFANHGIPKGTLGRFEGSERTPTTKRYVDIQVGTVEPASGESELGLDVLDDDTIVNRAGDALSAPFGASERYGIPSPCDPAFCDDGIACNGVETCGPDDTCIPADVPDCDGNGEADACEIEDCAGDPACGDCNGDGVPNSCEIADCGTAGCGAVGWWKGEADASDSQGANHGTLLNGASIAAGHVGNGFLFDGVDDYIEIPADPSLAFTTAMTVSAWVRVDQTVSVPGILGDLDESVGLPLMRKGWRLTLGNGFDTPAFEVGLSDETPVSVGASTAIGDGQFHHLAASFDAGILKIYVDGGLENTADGSGLGTTIAPSAMPLHIGTTANTANHNGAIDEVQLFDRALSDAEILAIFDAGTIGSCNENPACTDCNENGIPDGCDIDGGEPDGDANGIPDVCECLPTDAPLAVLPHPENRYLTIEPQNAGGLTALRVTLDELLVPDPFVAGSPDFSSFDGQVRWVGPPAEYPEGATPTPSFFAAQIQCEPHFADWSTFGTISVYGDAVVPSSSYTIQAIDESCAGAIEDESSYSAGLPMITSRWADVAEPFQPPSTFTQPNISDILLIVDKFLGAFPPLKSSTQLLGNVPDPNVKPDINDVLLAVDSFLGKPYPYSGPVACP